MEDEDQKTSSSSTSKSKDNLILSLQSQIVNLKNQVSSLQNQIKKISSKNDRKTSNRTFSFQNSLSLSLSGFDSLYVMCDHELKHENGILFLKPGFVLYTHELSLENSISFDFASKPSYFINE